MLEPEADTVCLSWMIQGLTFWIKIGDMDFSLQAKLLRVLQSHEIMRIGRNTKSERSIMKISTLKEKVNFTGRAKFTFSFKKENKYLSTLLPEFPHILLFQAYPVF